MNAVLIIPLVGQLLKLGLKLADIIEKADDVSVEDKEAMRALIKDAKDSVTYWNSEDGP